MQKKKLKVVLEVLDNASANYSETTQYINKNMKEVYERGKLKVKKGFCCYLV